MKALDEFGMNLARLAQGLKVEDHFKLMNNLLYQGRKHYGVDVSYRNITFNVAHPIEYLPEYLSGPETIGNSTGRMMVGWMYRLKNVFSSATGQRNSILNDLSGVI